MIGSASNADSNCLALARLLPDGEPDSATYGDGGTRCHGSLFEGGSVLRPTDALLQPDGKLIVAGYDSDSKWPVICRFDASGQLDALFGSSATAGCAVLDDIAVTSSTPAGAPEETRLKVVSIERDGGTLRIALAAGNFPTFVHLARLTAGGIIVPYGQSATLQIPSDDDLFLSDIAMTGDGKLAIAGVYNGDGWKFALAVVDPDTGEMDPAFNAGTLLTFSPTGGSYDVATTLAVTPEGHLAIAGASGIIGDGMRPTAAILTRQGEFLPDFHSGQPATYNPCVFYFGDCEIYVTGIEPLANGKLLLGGYEVRDGVYRAYTMRLNADGTPDAHYGPNFPGQQGYAQLENAQEQVATSMLLQDGRTVLAGWRDVGGPNGKDFFVTRLSDGSLFRDGFDAGP